MFPTLWHEFAVGLAVYWRLNVAAPAACGLGRGAGAGRPCAVLGGLAGADAGGLARPPAFGLVLIVPAAAGTSGPAASRWLGPLRACGRRCYSIYLVHLPVCLVGSLGLYELGLRGFWIRTLVLVPAISPRRSPPVALLPRGGAAVQRPAGAPPRTARAAASGAASLQRSLAKRSPASGLGRARSRRWSMVHDKGDPVARSHTPIRDRRMWMTRDGPPHPLNTRRPVGCRQQAKPTSAASSASRGEDPVPVSPQLSIRSKPWNSRERSLTYPGVSGCPGRRRQSVRLPRPET